MTIDPFSAPETRDFPRGGTPHTRPEGKECPVCEGSDVVYTVKNGQAVAHCTGCGQSRGNIPKSELGLRPVRYREGNAWQVGPGQRARILQRDGRLCVMCRTGETDLVMGHLVSVAEGVRYGLTQVQLMDDVNIAAMCGPCNADLGSRSVSLRMIVALRAEWERRNDDL